MYPFVNIEPVVVKIFKVKVSKFGERNDGYKNGATFSECTVLYL